MKKLIILTAIFCVCFQTIAVLAATPDYSGEWTLDVSKSKLPDAAKVESMTLKVSQTAKELRVETTAKRNADAGRGGIGSGGMRRGGNSDGVQTVIYNLDGKPAAADIGSGIMAGSETRTAKVTADGKLSLTTTRSFKSEIGGSTTKSNETWELLDGGKTLKIIRYVETSGGGINSETYFTKKMSAATKVVNTDLSTVIGVDNSETEKSRPKLKPLTGGVLNKKAVALPLPLYPPAARAVKAVGVVNVQVTIDEVGNIVMARAVSGHPLLRQAAEDAARQAKFAPTILEGNPVRVTGIIVYNFMP